MSTLAGKVALISGAARGMGRAHALGLAEDGADIVAFDIASQSPSVPYPGATPDDLAATAAGIEALGRQVLARTGDVRDASSVDAIVAEALERFGHIDIVVANAGILLNTPSLALRDEQWRDIIDVNLTGVWHTIQSALPAMTQSGRGGSIVIIGSGAIGYPRVAAYSASKAGCVGLMRSLAAEFASSGIRVNLIHPTIVGTPMILNEPAFRRSRPDLDAPGVEDVLEQLHRVNSMDVPYVEPEDVAAAVRWLSSDAARYVTGAELRVDAGAALQH